MERAFSESRNVKLASDTSGGGLIDFFKLTF